MRGKVHITVALVCLAVSLAALGSPWVAAKWVDVPAAVVGVANVAIWTRWKRRNP